LVLDSGFPTPRTQIAVVDEHGMPVRILDLGWEDYQVALEYDGDQHQSSREQYLKDRRVMPLLRRLNWHVTTVVKEDDPVVVLRTLHDVLRSRGWSGQLHIPPYAYQRRHWARTASAQGFCEERPAGMQFRRGSWAYTVQATPAASVAMTHADALDSFQVPP
jgi:hypothetical protein